MASRPDGKQEPLQRVRTAMGKDAALFGVCLLRSECSGQVADVLAVRVDGVECQPGAVAIGDCVVTTM